jgi:DNA (cytosine-5)-methyltransferase 1
MPTFGSLFAGIGGIDLGLERAGWECRWQVEWDGFCQTSLARNWAPVVRRGDVTAVDFRELERVDLIAGGFPCQPVSVAGRQRGRADERWLWPEFARAIRDVGPSFVLVENVRNLLAIDDGRPFGEVLGSLAALGYDAEWDCIPASAFGAPHERDRLWLLAYPDERRRERDDARSNFGSIPSGDGSGAEMADADGDAIRLQPEPKSRRRDPAITRSARALADDDSERREIERGGGLPAERDAPRRGHVGRRGGADAVADPDVLDAQGLVRSGDDEAVGEVSAERSAGLRGGVRRHRFGPPQSRVVRAPDGLPTWMDGHQWPAPPGRQYDWEPPRTVIGRMPNRAQRVKALGNAVVPQIPEHLGRRLLAAIQAA